MPELTPTDVQTFTSGRLSASNNEVQAMLTTALRTARRFCRWHVSPVKENHSLTMDGPGSRILWLPTRKLIELTSLSENGTVLNPSSYGVSAGEGTEDDRPVAVRKASGGFWTANYGGIGVVMTHGYTEDEAADWRRAVLSMVDQMSQIPIKVTSGAGELASIRVDDVQYSYQTYGAAAEDALYSHKQLLTDYALPTLEFL